ncbi:hypothetical protein [Ralstonia pseudosolanacearum]|uniref:hypothetical protein n=1 Tax=Ralstonia pseudosolanacearum TaxID=1310165 RepID=UPI001FF74BC2|nr:hypothetical protein [Ralstonia pseudosolanacearum]
MVESLLQFHKVQNIFVRNMSQFSPVSQPMTYEEESEREPFTPAMEAELREIALSLARDRLKKLEDD